MTSRANEQDYRGALQLAERALMHAEKHLKDHGGISVYTLVKEARAEVSRVLDIGIEDSDGMILT